MTLVMSAREVCERRLANDERNIECARYAPQHRADVIADCAQRLFQARAISRLLADRAEENLRAALEGWRA